MSDTRSASHSWRTAISAYCELVRSIRGFSQKHPTRAVSTDESQSPYRTPRVSPVKAPSLRQLRRYAIARSLFKATSLPRAIARLGFVQADPMRAPARAQDLILAQRVKHYRR